MMYYVRIDNRRRAYNTISAARKAAMGCFTDKGTVKGYGGLSNNPVYMSEYGKSIAGYVEVYKGMYIWTNENRQYILNRDGTLGSAIELPRGYGWSR